MELQLIRQFLLNHHNFSYPFRPESNSAFSFPPFPPREASNEAFSQALNDAVNRSNDHYRMGR